MKSQYKYGSTIPKRPVCVLIAEDDKEMREFLASALRRDSYDVFEISSDKELHRYFKETLPKDKKKHYLGLDVIVSDIRMPGKTPLDVLGVFKRFARKVPIVLITEFGDRETVEEAMRLGATVVFDKPFDIHEFKACLAELVSRKRAET